LANKHHNMWGAPMAPLLHVVSSKKITSYPQR